MRRQLLGSEPVILSDNWDLQIFIFRKMGVSLEKTMTHRLKEKLGLKQLVAESPPFLEELK